VRWLCISSHFMFIIMIAPSGSTSSYHHHDRTIRVNIIISSSLSSSPIINHYNYIIINVIVPHHRHGLHHPSLLLLSRYQHHPRMPLTTIQKDRCGIFPHLCEPPAPSSSIIGTNHQSSQSITIIAIINHHNQSPIINHHNQSPSLP